MDFATFRRTHDGHTYVPDEEDLNILARALWGEEGEKAEQKAMAATAWTWMNRYMLHPGQIRHWPRLADLIKGHSQPVNPKWRRDGAYCRPGGSKASSGDCEERLLQRREKYAFTAWPQVPATTREFAARFLCGGVEQFSDPPLVNFAAWSRTKNKSGVVQVVPGGQGYLPPSSDSSSSYWKPGTVEVSGGSYVDQMSKLGKYALIVGGLVVLSAGALLASGR